MERNFTQELQDLKMRINVSHKKLLTVFGKLKEVVLPTDEEINNKASDILNSLDVPMEDLPFSFQSKGQCIQSKKYPIIAIAIDYIIESDSIAKVVYSPAVGGCDYQQ